jgi:hypothetical protein
MSDANNPRSQRFPEQIADASVTIVKARMAMLQRQWTEATPPPEEMTNPIQEAAKIGLEHRRNDRDLLLASARLDEWNALWPRADKTLNALIAAYPEDAEGWNDLGIVKISLRDFDGAGKALVNSVKFSKPSGDTLSNPIYLSAAENLILFYANRARGMRDERSRTGSQEAAVEGDRLAALASEAFRDYSKYAPSADSNRMREELLKLGIR